MTQDELNAQRRVLWQRLKSSRSLLFRAHYLAEGLEKRYNEDKREYERIDHELALVDGRTSKLAYLESAKKRVKERPLTTEQLKEIAAKLGIDLESLKVE